MSDVLELAINLFRQTVLESNGRYYGIELRGDSRVPVLEAWDAERDVSVMVGFFTNDAERTTAEALVRTRATEGYRKYQYACGVVPIIAGASGEWLELDWLPTEADEAAYRMAMERSEADMQAHIALMKAQGLWRLKDVP